MRVLSLSIDESDARALVEGIDEAVRACRCATDAICGQCESLISVRYELIRMLDNGRPRPNQPLIWPVDVDRTLQRPDLRLQQRPQLRLVHSTHADPG